MSSHRTPARLCALCTLAVLTLFATSAWASEPLGLGGTLWRPDLPGSPTPKPYADFYAPNTYDTSLPAGLTLVQTFPGSPGGIVGPLAGSVTTTLYKDGDGHLTFDYMITREAGSDFIVAASVQGAGWETVGITAAGITDPLGSSGTGDPAAEWTDGTPFQLARDSTLGTPLITFRTTGITSLTPPTFTLVGTVLGANDTSAHIWFQTDATEYTQGYFGVLSGSGSVGQDTVLVPLPDPASLALVGLGSCVLFLRRRPRRAAV